MPKKQLGLSPIVEYFANASNIPVPSGVIGVWLTMIGAGGGGGSGRRGSNGSSRYGGNGGQGGSAINHVYIPATLLGSTYSVAVSSSGGAGGAAVTTSNTNGNPGTKGGDTSFSSGSYTIKVAGGEGGYAGTATANSDTQNGLSVAAGFLLGALGSASGFNSSSCDFRSYAAGGGGGGGSIDNTNLYSYGGTAGGSLALGIAGGVGGTTGGTQPTSGTAIPAGFIGTGAGGGASVSNAVGQTGASAFGYGGGGGGGGASAGTRNSGAGGSGAPGYLRLIWDYRGTRKKFSTNTYNEYSGQTNSTGNSVPSNIRGCWLYMIGCGGAGGSGSTAAASTQTYGGQGGYGGCIRMRWIPASLLGNTYDVFIPSNRIGGAAVSSNGSAGNAGEAMAQSYFTSGTYSIYCDGGSPGAAGSSTILSWSSAIPSYTYDAEGGAGGPSGYSYVGRGYPPWASGMPFDYINDHDGHPYRDYGGAAGGGGGGRISSVDVPAIGANGGVVRSYGQFGGAAGTAPGSGSAPLPMIPGAGAGGGAAGDSSTDGYDGANATGHGGGGGGGGATRNGRTSGKGGNGGPGYIRIIWDYI